VKTVMKDFRSAYEGWSAFTFITQSLTLFEIKITWWVMIWYLGSDLEGDIAPVIN
jgi:hypothetical protein